MDENKTTEEKSDKKDMLDEPRPSVIEFPETNAHLKTDEPVSPPQEETEESPVEEEYPLLVAVDTVLEDVEAQQKRLRSRNSGDLKSELRMNVYPQITNLGMALHDFMIDVLEMLTGGGEEISEEEAERFRQEAIRRGKQTIEVCKVIVNLSGILEHPMIKKGMAEVKIPKLDWDETVKPGMEKIVAWAKDTIDESVAEAEKTESEPEE